MTPQTPDTTLTRLLKLPTETEWVEFKEAKGQYDLHKLGCYFSAISNEARLNGKDSGWIVFGVREKPRAIVGTQYKNTPESLGDLKREISLHATNGITFVQIHEIDHPDGRVLIFQIPPAPFGMPIAWKNKFYGRDGEHLSDLKQDEIDRIRDVRRPDWSGEICTEASLNDLDSGALQKARENYVKKFGTAENDFNSQVASWNDSTFLKKAKILNPEGGITKTALLLLGKPEASYYLLPLDAKITWSFYDDKNGNRDYGHFGPPFLLNADKVFSRIRNLNYRYLVQNTLFPTETNQYEKWVLREAIHNAIAHQNYALGGRIVVKEYPDRVTVVNVGNFFCDHVEDFTSGDHVPERYRNPWLCSAMFNLNMIDQLGSGIHRMIQRQRNRYFPLPEWVTGSDKVSVTIYGKILDENFTRILIENTELDLKTIIALDKVQKGHPLTKEQTNRLKSLNLIEGRKPHYHISAQIADVANKKADYIRNYTFDKAHFEHLILTYLQKFKQATRRDIDGFLLEKLPDLLTATQKKNKVSNLLNEMANKKGLIRNTGNRTASRWALTHDAETFNKRPLKS